MKGICHVDYERIRFDRLPVGIIATYPCSVDGAEFACKLRELSCNLPDIEDAAVDFVAQERVIPSAQDACWMDFDTLQNGSFAEPASERPDTAYQRLTTPKLELEGYNCYVDETEEGSWYVVHKQ